MSNSKLGALPLRRGERLSNSKGVLILLISLRPFGQVMKVDIITGHFRYQVSIRLPPYLAVRSTVPTLTRRQHAHSEQLGGFVETANLALKHHISFDDGVKTAAMAARRGGHADSA